MALTLAETRAERADLDRAIKRHKAECAWCGGHQRGANRHPCEDGRALAARRAEAARLIKTWFDPGPDQGMLE